MEETQRGEPRTSSIYTPLEEPEFQQISRRKFLLQTAKGIFTGVIAVGSGVFMRSSQGNSEKNPRDRSRPATHFWTYDGKNTKSTPAEPVATIGENSQLNPRVIKVETTSDKVFSSADIPAATDKFPALVLFNPNHQDPIDARQSLLERVLTRSKDIVGADRMMLILVKNPDLRPGILSGIEGDDSVKKLSFFPLNPEKDENLPTTMKTYFSEFKFSDELLDKIISGEVLVYWRNFGSRLGHGQLPDIYLINNAN